jgi:uncharacterized protein (TIGR02722 family)
MKKVSLLCLLLAGILAGCGGGTQYRDAAKDEGSMEWGPREIKTTVNKMVGSLYDYLKNDWKKPAILQVQKIRNRTSEHIDTEMLSNELVTNLIQKRIQFIDDSYTKEAIEEMGKGMTGIIDPDSAVPAGALKSPNFYLFGEISDNVRFVGKKRVQYLVVTIKLTNTGTRMLVWQQQQEFLKATSTNKISF